MKLYPNPATEQARLSYQLPSAARNAELRFYSLLTGRQVAAFKLPTASRRGEQAIPLTALPAGSYSYRLVVDGQPGAVRHFVVR